MLTLSVRCPILFSKIVICTVFWVFTSFSNVCWCFSLTISVFIFSNLSCICCILVAGPCEGAGAGTFSDVGESSGAGEVEGADAGAGAGSGTGVAAGADASEGAGPSEGADVSKGADASEGAYSSEGTDASEGAGVGEGVDASSRAAASRGPMAATVSDASTGADADVDAVECPGTGASAAVFLLVWRVVTGVSGFGSYAELRLYVVLFNIQYPKV